MGICMKKKIGLGLQINHQRQHIFEQAQAKASFQYALICDNKFHNLSFGISAGIIQKQINIQNASIKDKTDSAIADYALTNVEGVADIGASYTYVPTDNNIIQIDASVLNFSLDRGYFNNQVFYQTPMLLNTGLKWRHYFNKEDNASWAIEPIFLLQIPLRQRFQEARPVQTMDIGSNVILSFTSSGNKELDKIRVSMGATLHTSFDWLYKSAVVNTNLTIGSHLRVGAAYEFVSEGQSPLGNNLQFKAAYLLSE
jgi:Type IX secretion system membrane protein PorP/SprF